MATPSDQNQAMSVSPSDVPSLPADEVIAYVSQIKVCDVHGLTFISHCADCNIKGGPNADHTLELSPRQLRRRML